MWKPIETAPRDGTPIDTWHKDGARLVDNWWDDTDNIWVSTLSGDEDYTHWMPTPDPPMVG